MRSYATKSRGRGWLGCTRNTQLRWLEIMALQTQYSRSRSARTRSTGNQKKGSGTDLHEMSRNKTSVAEFAAEHSLRAKSEVGVEQARREAKGDGRKQAWAPPKRQSLISNSARSQRDPLRTLPPHPSSGASSSGTKVYIVHS